MKYRKIGNTDLKISEISMGCWVSGGGYWGKTDDNESIKTIQDAIDNGINMLDTAEIYNGGHSEEVVGEAIIGRRDKVYLSSKVWKANLREKDVIKACEGSLQRMGTDVIDIYFVHYPSDESIPFEETYSALEKLKKDGKIRAIGLSNHNEIQLKNVLKVGNVDLIQPCYSLLWREIDEGLLEFCGDNNIGVVVYSPLAQGILTGKFDKNTKFSKNDGRSNAPLFQQGVFEQCLNVVGVLRPYAVKYEKTIAQVAINWVINRDAVTSAIVGARNEKQLIENINASGWKISESDLKKIDEKARKITDVIPKFENFFTNKKV